MKLSHITVFFCAVTLHTTSNGLTFSIINKSVQDILNARVYPDDIKCDPLEISDDYRPLQPQKSFSASSLCAQAFSPRVTIFWSFGTTVTYTLSTDEARPNAGQSLEIEIHNTNDLSQRFVDIIYYDKYDVARKERFDMQGNKLAQ